MINYLPLALNLQRKHCVVIGGGKVAERKVISLIPSGADITVISPTLTKKLSHISAHFTYICRDFYPGDTKGAFLVVAATNNRETNIRIYEDCKDAVPLINVIDLPEYSTFHFPAVIKRGKLQISISTSGVSPALAKKIKERISIEYGPEYEPILSHISVFRKLILNQVSCPDTRMKLLSLLVNEPIWGLFKEGNLEGVVENIRTIAPDFLYQNITSVLPEDNRL